MDRRRRNVLQHGLDRMNLPNGRGSIQRLSERRALVMVSYNARTSIKCPCDDVRCNRLVKVGRYGMCGDGSRTCVHCGKGRGDTFYKGLHDLRRHVKSNRCMLAQFLKIRSESGEPSTNAAVAENEGEESEEILEDGHVDDEHDHDEEGTDGVKLYDDDGNILRYDQEEEHTESEH